MRIVGSTQSVRPTTWVKDIPTGTVFTGVVSSALFLPDTSGPFLKLNGHIVNLMTSGLIGAGIGTTMVVTDYKEWPNATLDLMGQSEVR
jgi:hypothetical protein